MAVVEGSVCRALRIRQLAKHIISHAQTAGDLREFGVASHLLHMAEALLLDESLTTKCRANLAVLLIGAHQRFWHLRDQHGVDIQAYRIAILHEYK